MSKKDIVMKKLIKGIAEGRFKIGEKLPPERVLSEDYSISRIIVHSAIVELTAKGLLSIIPRKGVTVNDYKRHGNIDLLEFILTSAETEDEDLLKGLLDARMLLEKEFASLAATYRTEFNLKNLEKIIGLEKNATDILERTELDFAFHHEIAHSTANTIYPLLIKSMEHTYKRFIKEYYLANDSWDSVYNQHIALYDAIYNKDAKRAESIMTALIDEGAKRLTSVKINK